MVESLLVLSDVHLGSDLNDLQEAPKRSQSIDADLVRLLHHYRNERPKGARWRLVIAGDFIDFIGMVVRHDASDPDISTTPTDEERAHGLGNAADHARKKLLRVASRHKDVFEALAAFVAEGHALTLVHGNHDIEFHWEAVKVEFRSILLSHALSRVGFESVHTPAFATQFFERISFSPWFFYEKDVVYIEHGHQYDPLCSAEHVMHPVSVDDPRRIARGFCDVLLRYVVRPTRGMREHGHERTGLFYYVAFAFRLGAKGLFSLGLRFLKAVLALFQLQRSSFVEARVILREEHERRMALLAEATRLGLDRLRSVAALHAPPVTRSIRGILASVLLDRLALGLFCSILCTLFALLGMAHGHYFWGLAGVLVAWVHAHRRLVRSRKLEPDDVLIEKATRLANVFPVAFIVMGHTHVPTRVSVSENATYINVGSWAEEEDSHAYRAARTHLIIHPAERGAHAEFLTWSPEGPAAFSAQAPNT